MSIKVNIFHILKSKKEKGAIIRGVVLYLLEIQYLKSCKIYTWLTGKKSSLRNSLRRPIPSSAFSVMTGALSTRISSGLGSDRSGVLAAGSNRSWREIQHTMSGEKG